LETHLEVDKRNTDRIGELFSKVHDVEADLCAINEHIRNHDGLRGELEKEASKREIKDSELQKELISLDRFTRYYIGMGIGGTAVVSLVVAISALILNLMKLS